MFFLLLVAGALALACFVFFAPAVPAVLRMAVAVIAGLLAFATPAYADTSLVADLVGSVVWPILWPFLCAIGAVALLAAGNAVWKVVNRAMDLFQQRTGIQIDAERRAALHSALDTGLHLAIKRGAPILEDAVAAWVRKSVPDAVDHFGLTTEMLDGLVDAKLGKAVAAAPLALPGALLSGLGEAAAGAAELVTAPLSPTPAAG